MNPPDHALVFCIDEKSQIQALDRTQPGLPMKKGQAGTMTHDYKRHGTTTLFTALDVLKGAVIGRCMPRHRHQEFPRFLKAIDRSTRQPLLPASFRSIPPLSRRLPDPPQLGSGQRESRLRYSPRRMAVASSPGVAIGGLEPPFNPLSASRIARTPAARMSCG
jgi:hypothetical protein